MGILEYIGNEHFIIQAFCLLIYLTILPVKPSFLFDC